MRKGNGLDEEEASAVLNVLLWFGSISHKGPCVEGLVPCMWCYWEVVELSFKWAVLGHWGLWKASLFLSVSLLFYQRWAALVHHTLPVNMLPHHRPKIKGQPTTD
jgi:hypothetical protein